MTACSYSLKHRIMFLLLAFLSLVGCSKAQSTGNADEGFKKAAICAQCHGKQGISIVPIYPNLAGQKRQYLELALHAYRSGERINMAMTPHARKLSDEDIADLAAYYSELGSGLGNEQGSELGSEQGSGLD